MITNHYGHTVDSEVPITGVLNISDINTQVLNDCIFYEGGINLDSLDRVDNYLIEHGLSELDDTSRLALMGDYITSDTGYLCYNLPDEFYDNDY